MYALVSFLLFQNQQQNLRGVDVIFKCYTADVIVCICVTCFLGDMNSVGYGQEAAQFFLLLVPIITLGQTSVQGVLNVSRVAMKFFGFLLTYWGFISFIIAFQQFLLCFSNIHHIK